MAATIGQSIRFTREAVFSLRAFSAKPSLLSSTGGAIVRTFGPFVRDSSDIRTRAIPVSSLASKHTERLTDLMLIDRM